MRLRDTEFWGYVDLIMDLDWKDYDFTIFGGITGNWETQDIDGAIWGEYDPVHIKYLLDEMKKLGPFDCFYSNHPTGRDWDNTMQPMILNVAKTVDRGNPKAKARFGGQWYDNLYWINIGLPNIKMKQRNDAYQYGKPITLIQNGQQLYF